MPEQIELPLKNDKKPYINPTNSLPRIIERTKTANGLYTTTLVEEGVLLVTVGQVAQWYMGKDQK